MPSDTIGNLTAVVRATADTFDKDCQQIILSLKQVQDAARKGHDALQEGFEIGAGIEAFQKGIELAQAAVEKFFAVFEHAHQLEATAAIVGSTVKELQGLQFAAAQSGSDAEGLNTSLGRLESQLGKAMQGSKEAALGFQTLGLNVKQLANETTGAALEEIAEKIRQLPNAANRAAVAVEIFGKAGRQMLPMLMEGAAGIDALKKKADELGGVMGDDDVKAAADAQKSINELKLAWQGLWNALATTVIPVLTSVVGTLKDVMVWAHSAGTAISDFFARLNEVDQSVDTKLKENMKRLEESTAANRAGGGVDVVEAHKQAAAAAKEREKREKEAAKAVAEQAKEMDKNYAQMIRSSQQHADQLAKHGQQIKDSVRTPLEKLKDTLTDLGNLLNVGAIDWETYSRAAEKAASGAEKALEKHKEIQERSVRGGIGAHDINTMEGASLMLSAERARQDIGGKEEKKEQEMLDHQKIHTDLLKMIERNTGHHIDFQTTDLN